MIVLKNLSNSILLPFQISIYKIILDIYKMQIKIA